jgi:hypothetical protein
MLFQYETMKNKIYIMLNKVFRHANMFVCSTRHGIDQASAAHHMKNAVDTKLDLLILLSDLYIGKLRWLCNAFLDGCNLGILNFQGR